MISNINRNDTQTRPILPLESFIYEGPQRILFIPDTHWSPDTKREDFKVIRALGRAARAHDVDIVVHIGDANDVGSLSSWDIGKRSIEGKRLRRDLKHSRECLQLLNDCLGDKADVDRYLLEGNHEDRLYRMYDNQPALHGVFGDDPFGYKEAGWYTTSFLSMVEINRVIFSHFFQNPTSVMGGPIGGTIDNCIKNLGHSFCQGHVQTLKQGQIHRSNGDIHCGLIAGACYIPDHSYKGPQGNSHWKGAVILDNMEEGYYDTKTIGLRSLLRRYT